jgi:DNA polymerase-3 subunit delta
MIFFFYGDDTYRAYQKIKQIRDKFRREVDPSGFNTVLLDGTELTLEKFNEAVSQAGFLANKRLIIIKNVFDNKTLNKIREEILNYLNKQTDSAEENLLLFWQEGDPKGSDPLYKKLKTYKYVQGFDLLKTPQLAAWVKEEIKTRGGQITAPALNLLIVTVGDNLWQLSGELDKLINYKGGQTIIEQDIELLTHGKLDENIFNLTDAITNRQTARALKLIREQLQAGANEQYLLGMILRQFRILIQLKSLLENGETTAALAKQTGLHPFVIKKSLPWLTRYSLPALRQIYQDLTKLDLNMKSSSIASETFLNLFIIKNALG